MKEPTRRQFFAALGVAASIPTIWGRMPARVSAKRAAAATQHIFGITLRGVPDSWYADPKRFAHFHISPAIEQLAQFMEQTANGRKITLFPLEVPKGVEFAGQRRIGKLPLVREVRAWDPVTSQMVHRLDIGAIFS